MRFKFNLLAFAFSVAILLIPRFGLSQEDAFPANLQEDLSKGTSAIYQLDFDKARSHFRNAVNINPAHPAAYFFQLMCTWYELTYDSLMYRNAELEKQLGEEAEQATQIAEAFTKSSATAAVGHLYWGGAQGAKGWYNVTRRNWIRAYFAGKNGYSHMKKVLEIDPELYDAYLGVGVFEYYAATLGRTLRVLASLMIRGNKEEAEEYLNLAKTKSRFVRLEAAYFLWNAASDEKRLEDAYAMALEFKNIFPESPFLRWCEIYSLFQMEKWSEMIEATNEYMILVYAEPKVEEGLKPSEKILSKIYYHAGIAAYEFSQLGLAKNYFEMAIKQEAEFKGWKALAALRRGEMDDLVSQRAQALEHYRAVLKMPDIYNSHKTAKRRIKKPYGVASKKYLGILDRYTPLQTWR